MTTETEKTNSSEDDTQLFMSTFHIITVDLRNLECENLNDS